MQHFPSYHPVFAKERAPNESAVPSPVPPIPAPAVPRHFRETKGEGLAAALAYARPAPTPEPSVPPFPPNEPVPYWIRPVAPPAPNGLAGDSAARKEAPVYSGVLCYFPNALAEVARLSKRANDKHNPGEPMHWSFNKSNDHGDCIVRHQCQADEVDAEDGFLHAVKVAWRALAQLETMLLTAHPELAPGKNVKGAR